MLERAKEITTLIRDIGLILGIPTIIAVGLQIQDMQDKAVEQQIRAAEAQTKVLEQQLAQMRDTQFDRVSALIRGQRETYEAERALIQNERAILQGRLTQAIETMTTLQTDYRGRLTRLSECTKGLIQEMFVEERLRLNNPENAPFVANMLTEFCGLTALLAPPPSSNP